jgi:hypothetical protein
MTGDGMDLYGVGSTVPIAFAKLIEIFETLITIWKGYTTGVEASSYVCNCNA